MKRIVIYHGSENIIKKPNINAGKMHNDYGRGFYCTENIELAKEWACKRGNDGFANEYELNLAELKILNLNSKEYTILNWIAILLKNRVFTLDNNISNMARNYIIENFSVDVENYDVVIGYRADDSYFAFADAFISNSLSLRSLNRALRLGKFGEQVALVSEKAFESIQYIDAIPAESGIYYSKFYSRDNNARMTNRNEIAHTENVLDDIFVLDIIRQEMKNDDPRIQRIISE